MSADDAPLWSLLAMITGLLLSLAAWVSHWRAKKKKEKEGHADEL